MVQLPGFDPLRVDVGNRLNRVSEQEQQFGFRSRDQLLKAREDGGSKLQGSWSESGVEP